MSQSLNTEIILELLVDFSNQVRKRNLTVIANNVNTQNSWVDFFF